MANLQKNWKHIVNPSVTEAVNDRVYGLSLSKGRHKWKKKFSLDIFQLNYIGKKSESKVKIDIPI